jgi:hypothetical protein
MYIRFWNHEYFWLTFLHLKASSCTLLANRQRLLILHEVGNLNPFATAESKQRFDVIKHAGLTQRILVWV